MGDFLLVRQLLYHRKRIPAADNGCRACIGDNRMEYGNAPPANTGFSKYPTGPFQIMVFALAMETGQKALRSPVRYRAFRRLRR
jgi:hypothetical protein